MPKRINSAKIDELSLVFKELGGVEWSPRNSDARVLLVKAAAAATEALAELDETEKAGKRHSAADQANLDQMGASASAMATLAKKVGGHANEMAGHAKSMQDLHAQLNASKAPATDSEGASDAADPNEGSESEKADAVAQIVPVDPLVEAFNAMSPVERFSTLKAMSEHERDIFTALLDKAKVGRTLITDTKPSGPPNAINQVDGAAPGGAAKDDGILDGSSTDGKDAATIITDTSQCDGPSNDINEEGETQPGDSGQQPGGRSASGSIPGGPDPMQSPANGGVPAPATPAKTLDRGPSKSPTVKAEDIEMTQDQISTMIAKAAKDAADAATSAVTKAMGAQIAALQVSVTQAQAASATATADTAKAQQKAATAEAEAIAAKAAATAATEAAASLGAQARKPTAGSSAKLTKANEATRLVNRPVFMEVFKNNPQTHAH